MEEPVTSIPVRRPHTGLFFKSSHHTAHPHPNALIGERAASDGAVSLTHRGQGFWESQGEDILGDPWNQREVLLSSQTEGTGDVTQEILKAEGPPEFVT